MIARTPKDVGFLIREARQKKGLSQEELAGIVGVSRKWIMDVEGGKPGTEIGLVLRTLNVVGLTVNMVMRSNKSGVDINAIVDAAKSEGGTK